MDRFEDRDAVIDRLAAGSSESFFAVLIASAPF
jgi:hypothetical protein